MSAAQQNDLEGLRRLLDLEKKQNPWLGTSSVNTSTTSMQRAAAAAARHNHPQALDLILDNGSWVDPDTVLSALSGKCKEIIDCLISRGWDINVTLGHIGDPLICAVMGDDLDFVQFILSREADPNNGNITMSGLNAIEVAAMASSIPVIKALLDAGAILKGRSTLPKAASQGRTEIISYLLDQGASINEIPNNPDIFENKLEQGVKNALCHAAYSGQSEVVKFLLGRGADASITDTNGKSALDIARARGHEDCVNILREVVKERYD